MTLASSPRSARAWRALRFAGLVLVALFLAHDAVFAVGSGLGHGMDVAMAAAGHDGWWTPYATGVMGVAATLVIGALLRLRRLNRLAAGFGLAEGRFDPGGYARELLGLWRAVFPMVTLLLVAQENLEALHVGHGLVGLEPIGSPVALLAVALVAFAMSAVGALVRWRVRSIEARLAAARQRRPWARTTTTQPWATSSWLAGAMLRHRRLLLRDDPGRAPPAFAAPS